MGSAHQEIINLDEDERMVFMQNEGSDECNDEVTEKYVCRDTIE